MLKKLKRSIELMPHPAYIFIRNTFILCDVLLFVSFIMFMNLGSAVGYSERLMLAQLMLETPSGLLLMGLIGFALIYDNC